jgi:internalin A
MSDLNSIKEIEKELNISLNKADHIEWDTIGYVLDENGNVIELVLSNCGITNIDRIISPLCELNKLRNLYLGNNKITDVTPLNKLKNLNILILEYNSISELSSLSGSDNLTYLHVGYNKLCDISSLRNFNKLKYLYLHYNEISDITPLKELKNLESLSLSNNKINVYSPISKLISLKTLFLFKNEISDITSLIGLKNLTYLHLSLNKISDISPIKELNNLKYLNLGYNMIEKLPDWIVEIDMEIFCDENKSTGIEIGGNPINYPPINIIKQGKEAIRNYFEQLRKQGKDYIYEAKLMLVGEPGVGKTTLMKKLFDRDYPVPDTNQLSTLGIEIKPGWTFPLNGNRNFSAHIWDFGGQQIQYTLHQFFLTSDCLYILMAEKRKEHANFDYWLNILNILGKGSPVILLLNEINIDSVSYIYDEKKYKELFPDLNIKRLDINLSDMNDGRFDTLLDTIRQKLVSLNTIVGKEVPTNWVRVRSALEKRKNTKLISRTEYYKLCRENGLELEEDCDLVLQYFYLLGVVLHFKDDLYLRDTLFLDPVWTVRAIYTILIDKGIEHKNGIFDLHSVENIWTQEGYEKEEQSKLLQLMLKAKFDICYKLPAKENEYLIPLLLSKIKPEYSWDENNNLQFRFMYPFIPKGIISRLIVRINKYIENNIVWNEGAIFTYKDARAQVIETINPISGLKFIDIRLAGSPDSCKELLTLIREEIKTIQDSSFPNLPYTEMVPCLCDECKISSEPFFFEYNTLDNYVKKNKPQIECHKSTFNVNIAEMVVAIFPKQEDNSPERQDERKKVKIFLASSNELLDDRREFEIFISRLNDEFYDKGIFLQVILWEYSDNSISLTRKQDDYNKMLKECDFFVSLFLTKVGPYTHEEFKTAFDAFHQGKNPKYLYTYFKDNNITTGSITEEIITLLEFKKEIETLGQFQTVYKNAAELHLDFQYQLRMKLGFP